MERINLLDTTFMIPIRIESSDRDYNFKFVIQWLLKHLDTNIIVSESADALHAGEILKEIVESGETGGSSILYFPDVTQSPVFHRTKMLNEMLKRVKTPVVVNYDADILLEPQTYRTASDAILSGMDLVYPYFLGMSQKMVIRNRKDLPQSLEEMETVPGGSVAGHCQWFNTKSYRDGGGENEKFISYAPEDAERKHRFTTLGYRVHHLDSYVYHIEHDRGVNSSRENPYFKEGEALYQEILSMTPKQLREYYKPL